MDYISVHTVARKKEGAVRVIRAGQEEYFIPNFL